MRNLGSPRRLGVITATLMLAAGASALTACSSGTVELNWTAFGLESSVPDTTASPGDSTPSSGPDTTGVIVTTTEPVYSGEGAWLFITSSEVAPGDGFSIQVVGFAPNTEATIELRTSVGTTVLDTVTTDDEGGILESYALPRSTPEGDHRIVAVGTDPEGDEIEVGQRLTVDLTAPVVASFSASPTVVAVGNTVSVFVNVTDTYGVETVSIATRTQSGTTATWCTGSATLVSGSDTSGRWRANCLVPGTAPKTGYLVSATATDYSGNTATKVSTAPVFNTSNGADVTPPTVTSTSVSSSTVSPGDSITISVGATDGIGVENVKVTVRDPNGIPADWCDKYASLSSGSSLNGTWSTSCTVAADAIGGTYEVEIVASDAAGNATPSTVLAYFTVELDTTGPTITNETATPGSGPAGSTFTVSFTASDTSGVASASVGSIDGVITCNSASPSGSSWDATCTVDALAPGGVYTITISVSDTLGNDSSTTVSFEVTVV
jgi:hypothetical protein